MDRFSKPISKFLLFLAVFSALLLTFTLFPRFSSTPLAQSSFDQQEFDSFLLSHNKHYSSSEYVSRFRTFRDNLGYIRVFNSLKNDWTLGLTPFADLTPAEFKSLLSRVQVSSAGLSLASPLSIPSSVDWVAQGKVGPVINQGSLGYVLPIVVAENLASVWAIAGHTYTALSYQELVDCVGPNADVGSYGKFIATNGLTSNTNYPPTAGVGTCNKAKVAQPVAKASSYVDVTPNQQL
jgi:cathepsin L